MNILLVFIIIALGVLTLATIGLLTFFFAAWAVGRRENPEQREHREMREAFVRILKEEA